MVGWHHRLNGHEFEQTLGDNEGQGVLMCCRPWGHKEWDMTECIFRTGMKKYCIASSKYFRCLPNLESTSYY